MNSLKEVVETEKFFVIIIVMILTLFLSVKTGLINVKADNTDDTENNNLFEDFIYNKIEKYYYCYFDGNMWNAELRLIL